MINKKTLFGRLLSNEELGERDAVHVAIVAVRAGEPIARGGKVKINENGEAVRANGKGIGVADPYLKQERIATGEVFQLLLNPSEVPNVKHTWEHPEHSFAAPSRPPVRNRCLSRCADDLGMTYEELMAACEMWCAGRSVTYTGSLSLDLDEVSDIASDLKWDMFSEWSEETGFTFENYGSACCPEYEYPDIYFEEGRKDFLESA